MHAYSQQALVLLCIILVPDRKRTHAVTSLILQQAHSVSLMDIARLQSADLKLLLMPLS